MGNDQLFNTVTYKQAAVDYPKNLPKGDFYYLYVKPFDGGDKKKYSAGIVVEKKASCRSALD